MLPTFCTRSYVLVIGDKGEEVVACYKVLQKHASQNTEEEHPRIPVMMVGPEAESNCVTPG
jgi:hypothetical protein